MKLYIVGPMRGYDNHNFPESHKYAKVLRAAGHEVFNPAEEQGPLPIREALGLDLAWIVEHAEGVVTLPGWEDSKGALVEVCAATAIGIPVWDISDFVKRPK